MPCTSSDISVIVAFFVFCSAVSVSVQPTLDGACHSVAGEGFCENTTSCSGLSFFDLCPGDAAVTCCVKSAKLPFGPDVSNYQGTIDWHAVENDGVGFAIVKATEGLKYLDPTFKRNWEIMRNTSIRARGAYHFGHPSDDAEAQALFFTSSVGPMRPGEFLVLDIESATKSLQGDAVGDNAFIVWCSTFVNAAAKLASIPASRVWIYTGQWFWDPHSGSSSSLANTPLWVSGYTAVPPMPNGWHNWTMWQFSSSQRVNGISTRSDFSVFYGTQQALEKMVGH